MHVHIHTHTCIHIYIYTYTCTYTYIHTWIQIHKKPAKMAENDLVSGGHGRTAKLGACVNWVEWLPPVQISEHGLDGALS